MILLTDDLASRFFEIFNSWSNPIFLIVFIALIIIIIIFFLNRFLITPLEQEHIREKKEIELRNSRMMALFAELDPDPVIRVDMNGKVNFFNEAAAKLLKINIGDLVPGKIFNIPQQDFKDKVLNDVSYSFPFQFNSVYYNVLMKGNSGLGIAQFYLRDISEIKNLEIKLKQLSNYLQNQLDEERYRIAHELHDSIAQDLYLIQMGLRKLSDESNHSLLSLLQPIKSQLETTTIELRRIIYDLKPKILEEMGLEPALQTLCNNVTKETGLNGSIEIVGSIQRLDKKMEIYFYRIIQEAISNIIKHSQATEFSVVLLKDKDIIRTIISDNGCGIKEDNVDTNTLTGFGLMNIKERTEGLGGVLKIDSSENEGFTLITEIPLYQN